MQPQEELLLVKKAQAGDRSAFDKLYNKYKRIILNYLYSILNNRELAEELTQAALVKAYLNIHQFKPTGSFSSWMYAIARNVAKNEIRRVVRTRSVSLEKSISENGNVKLGDILKGKGYTAEEVLKNEETQNLIKKVMKDMPAHYKEVITLCVIQGVSYEDAAKILKCTKTTVANRLFRARKYFIDEITKRREAK